MQFECAGIKAKIIKKLYKLIRRDVPETLHGLSIKHGIIPADREKKELEMDVKNENENRADLNSISSMYQDHSVPEKQ